jgi:general secretion pathway protein D
MKTIPIILLIAGLSTRLNVTAADQPPITPAASNQPVAPPSTPAPATDVAPAVAPPANPPEAPAAPLGAAAAAVTTDTGTNGLRLNFRNAPLNLILDYLSDAAGFVINKETDVRGTVDVWSKEPLTKDEAVELLNSVLKKNGCAVTRNGRILTIVSLESVKTSDTDIVSGNKWEDVARGDEVVTQIVGVRYANASQLMNNLQMLLPTSATLSVNESANSLILVATKTDIRRMLKIVNALDTSIASVSSIKVFPLRYADAKQLATEVQSLFAPQTSGQGGGGMRGQLFNMFRGGGGPGGFGGPGGPGGGGGGGGSGGGSANGAKVVATADDFSNALIVLASSELMTTIGDMVQQIDQPTTDITELRVFKLINADPTELADQFATLFPDDTKAGSSGNQNNAGFRFFGGRGGGGGGGGGQTASNTDRMKKKTRVLAVADPRTSSILVSAASEMMPQIAEMIEKLDASAAQKMVVKTYELENADPQDVYQIMNDLFHKTGAMGSASQNNRSLLGTSNPLTQRSTQQQTTSGSSGFGTSSRGGGGGANLGF